MCCVYVVGSYEDGLRVYVCVCGVRDNRCIYACVKCWYMWGCVVCGVCGVWVCVVCGCVWCVGVR